MVTGILRLSNGSKSIRGGDYDLEIDGSSNSKVMRGGGYDLEVDGSSDNKRMRGGGYDLEVDGSSDNKRMRGATVTVDRGDSSGYRYGRMRHYRRKQRRMQGRKQAVAISDRGEGAGIAVEMLLEIEGQSRRWRSVVALVEAEGFGRFQSIKVAAVEKMETMVLEYEARKQSAFSTSCMTDDDEDTSAYGRDKVVREGEEEEPSVEEADKRRN
ncbi:hypothetical protein BHM03_00062128 [Ensete ventricosum]|nr:hypothetical protein BHM03_00062128 [Ensete ventricosum]